MKYDEKLMIKPFVDRYRKSRDINMERSIANKFLETYKLSKFRFVKFLGDYDDNICDDYLNKVEK